jgi:hypothetical protein
MKYLKRYSLFENLEYDSDWKKPDSPIRTELVNDLEDILIELVDLDYRILIGGFIKRQTPFIWIRNRSSSINWEEVNPVIERIEKFLDLEGFQVLNKEILNKGRIREQIYIYFDKKEQNIFEDFNKWTAYQHEYSIYDFTNDLKMNRLFSDVTLKMWVDHFIGSGYYDKINNLVDTIFSKLEKIDIMSIEDRLFEVFDQYADIENSTKEVVAYGDFYDIGKEKSKLFNGVIYTTDKKYLFKTIILNIITPTIEIRETDDEVYVKDEKWQCSNLDPKETFGYETLTTFKKSDYSKYNVDSILELYKPCVKIVLGKEFGGYKDEIPFVEVRNKFKEVMPLVIGEIEYMGLSIDEVVYPDEGYWLSDSTRVNYYKIKILLDL